MIADTNNNWTVYIAVGHPLSVLKKKIVLGDQNELGFYFKNILLYYLTVHNFGNNYFCNANNN